MASDDAAKHKQGVGAAFGQKRQHEIHHGPDDSTNKHFAVTAAVSYTKGFHSFHHLRERKDGAQPSHPAVIAAVATLFEYVVVPPPFTRVRNELIILDARHDE